MRSKIVDSSMADFTHCLAQTVEAATPTNFEAPILGPEDLRMSKTTEAATATNFEAQMLHPEDLRMSKTTEAATATNLKAPILEPEDLLKTTEAATATNPKPPTMGLDAADIDGFVAELSGISFYNTLFKTNILLKSTC